MAGVQQPPATAGGSAAAGAARSGLPMSHHAIQHSVTGSPTSFPLTLAQIEQSMGYSTSSSSAAAGAAAPAQAVTKGEHAEKVLGVYRNQ